MTNVYIIVVEDVIKQRREYVALGESEAEAKESIRNGLYAIESEPATLDTLSSAFISVEKLGESE